MFSQLLLTFALDCLLAVLLVATIYFCHRLNLRVKQLQDSKSELARLIKQFDETTERATASIIDLQSATKRIGENIQSKIDKANFLADDLSFMIEKGSKVADQMETGFNSGRKPNSTLQERAKPTPKPEMRAEAPTADVEEKPSISPRMARTAASPAPARAEAPAAAKTATSNQARASASLESVLERMAGRNAPAGNGRSTPNADPQDAAAKRGPSVRVRSKAEQELFDALKSGR